MTADSPRDLRSPPAADGPVGSRYRSPSPRGRRSPSPGRYNDRRRSPSPARRRYDDYRPPRRSSRSRSQSRSPYRGGAGRDYPSSSRRYNNGPRRERRPAPVFRGSTEERARSTTLFVGNIPYTFSERDVTDLVERHGPIRKITVPRDERSGNNRGYAFIEFAERKDAELAFDALSGGFKLDGRELRVDWDVGRENKAYPERPPREARDVRDTRDSRDSRDYRDSRDSYNDRRRYSRSPPRRRSPSPIRRRDDDDDYRRPPAESKYRDYPATTSAGSRYPDVPAAPRNDDYRPRY